MRAATSCSPVTVAYTWQRRLWLKLLLDILDEPHLRLPEPLMFLLAPSTSGDPRDILCYRVPLLYLRDFEAAKDGEFHRVQN